MRTVVLGDRPLELEQLIERRRTLGLDRYDEVREGDYHVAPHSHAHHGQIDRQLARILHPYALRAGLVDGGSFNLGTPQDYRVPDGGFYPPQPVGVYVSSATVVVEILSPNDETFAKFDFYARHGVQEVIVVDPDRSEFHCYALPSGDRLPRSEVLDVDMSELTDAIDWPTS